MTVSSPVSKVVHITNEALAGYAFPFKVFKAGELAVDLVDASFRVVPLELGADYTVDGLGRDQGGTITLTAPGRDKAGTGQSLVLRRRMDFVQETDYRPHDVFPAETHERALDILTMICQELREMMSRAIIAPPNVDEPIQYADLAALLEGAEEALARALTARDAAQTEADRAGAEADRAAAAADSLDLPPLSTASPGQVLTAVEQPDQSLKLEYAGRPGAYELCEFYYFRSPVLRPGFRPAQGGVIADAAGLYPQAWEYLQTAAGQLLCVTEAEWQALTRAVWHTNADGTTAGWNGIGGAPFFVQDLDAGTLRLPDLRGMYREAAGFDGLGVGDAGGDRGRDISGGFYARIDSISPTTGAFFVNTSPNQTMGSGGSNVLGAISFSASRVVPVGPRFAPAHWGALACVYLGKPGVVI
jgi:hypothetical protein